MLNLLRLIALSLGVGLYAVNINAIATLMPSIVDDIGGVGLYSWATSLFIAASIFSVSLSSSCITYLGLRASFLFALLLFLMGSLAVAFSPTMHILLGSRVLQGLGGGLLLGLSYSAVRIVFLEPFWLRAIAIVSSIWGLTALISPAVGGMIADNGNWRLAFVLLIPFCLLLTLLVLLSLRSRPETDHYPLVRVPVLKAALLAWSVLIMAFSGLHDSPLLIGLAIAIVATILYGIARDDQNEPESPLFPANSQSLRRPLGSLYAGIALLSAVVSIELYIPYFMQHIYALTPLQAGYMAALMPTGWAAGALAMSKRDLDFVGGLFIVGPLLTTASLISLGVLFFWPIASVNAIAVALVGVGLGVGVVWPHLLTGVFFNAPDGQENIASAAMINLQLYAMAVGTVVAGVITTLIGMSAAELAQLQLAAFTLFLSCAVLPLIFIFVSGPARRSV